jgi:hypothetical protein
MTIKKTESKVESKSKVTESKIEWASKENIINWLYHEYTEEIDEIEAQAEQRGRAEAVCDAINVLEHQKICKTSIYSEEFMQGFSNAIKCLKSSIATEKAGP